ncbi:MAG: PaaI family thioesterase [Microthrixaceae bacterium]
MSEVAYPPIDHVLRDLPFHLEVVGEHRQVARMHCDADTSLGAVATVLDVLGGSLCASVVAPDWMATSTLTLRVGALPSSGTLELRAQVLRAGRRSVTIEVTLRHADTERPVGDATLSFARLVRRETNLALSELSVEIGRRVEFERILRGEVPSFDLAIGTVAVQDPTGGATITELRPYVLNSFGALNGGVVAGVAVSTARHWAAAQLDPGSAVDEVAVDEVVADEVAVHHLGQGRSGPVRSTAREVTGAGAPGGRRVVRVDLVDTGIETEPDAVGGEGDGRLMAVAHVGLCMVRPQV